MPLSKVLSSGLAIGIQHKLSLSACKPPCKHYCHTLSNNNQGNSSNKIWWTHAREKEKRKSNQHPFGWGTFNASDQDIWAKTCFRNTRKASDRWSAIKAVWLQTPTDRPTVNRNRDESGWMIIVKYMFVCIYLQLSTLTFCSSFWGMTVRAGRRRHRWSALNRSMDVEM